MALVGVLRVSLSYGCEIACTVCMALHELHVETMVLPFDAYPD
jgi:molybdenum cofactor biosynthesis enzyme MoaA